MESRNLRNREYDLALAHAIMKRMGNDFYKKYHCHIDEHPEYAMEVSVAICNLELSKGLLAEHLDDILENIEYAYQVSFGLLELYLADKRIKEFDGLQLNLRARYKDIIIKNPKYAIEFARGISGYYFCEQKEPLPEYVLNFMLQHPKHAHGFGSGVGKLYRIHRKRLEKAPENEAVATIKSREEELFLKRIEMLMSQPESAKEFSEALVYLEQWDFPLELQSLLFHAGKHALTLLDGIIYLGLPEYAKYLFENPKYALDLVGAINVLIEAQLKYCMIFVVAFPEDARAISLGLVHLKQHGLSRYNDFILQHKKWAFELAKAIEKIESDPFLLPYKEKILKSPEHANNLVSSLQQLHAAGMEHHIPILFEHPEAAAAIGCGVKTLHAANLLPEYDRNVPVLNGNLADAIIFLKQSKLANYIPLLLKNPDCAYSFKDVVQEFINNAASYCIQNFENKEEAVQFMDYAFLRMHDPYFLVMGMHSGQEENRTIISAYADLCVKMSARRVFSYFREDGQSPDQSIQKNETNLNTKDHDHEETASGSINYSCNK